MTAAELNPRQARNLAALARLAEPPVFEPDLGARLETSLIDRLDPILARWSGEPLSVTKFDLSTLTLGECEERWRYERDQPFAWSPGKAVGSVAHRMCQLRLMTDPGEELRGADLYDEAIVYLVGDEQSVGRWLAGLDDPGRRSLRADAVELYQAFEDCFPWQKVGRSWLPTVEARYTWEHGPLKAAGKVDVQFGRVYAERAGVAGRGALDLKSGRVRHSTMLEGRHYALLTTLKLGVPPRLVGALSLETGELTVDHVDEAILWQAADTFVAATEASVDLQTGKREPDYRPGPLCGWCGRADDCEPGGVWLRARGRADD